MEQIGNMIPKFKELGVDIRRETENFSFGTTDECKNLFIQAFKFVDSSVDRIVWLPEYDRIIDWMTDTKGRGLLLSGPCGIGKSVIIKGVIPVLFSCKFNKNVIPYAAEDMNSKQSEIESHRFICIDDIGVEATRVEYGERKEVFCEIVSNAENKLKPLFVSTNLKGADIRNRYGDRVRSRLNRLCNCIVFNDSTKDLRVF